MLPEISTSSFSPLPKDSDFSVSSKSSIDNVEDQPISSKRATIDSIKSRFCRIKNLEERCLSLENLFRSLSVKYRTIPPDVEELKTQEESGFNKNLNWGKQRKIRYQETSYGQSDVEVKSRLGEFSKLQNNLENISSENELRKAELDLQLFEYWFGTSALRLQWNLGLKSNFLENLNTYIKELQEKQNEAACKTDECKKSAVEENLSVFTLWTKEGYPLKEGYLVVKILKYFRYLQLLQEKYQQQDNTAVCEKVISEIEKYKKVFADPCIHDISNFVKEYESFAVAATKWMRFETQQNLSKIKRLTKNLEYASKHGEKLDEFVNKKVLYSLHAIDPDLIHFENYSALIEESFELSELLLKEGISYLE